MRISTGSAQDPLNYLLRSVRRSTRYSKILKAHLVLHIKRLKHKPSTSFDEAVSDTTAMMSYAEIQHLRETIETLKPTDKGYSQAVHAWSKLMENYRRSLSRGGRLKAVRSRTPQPTRTPPMRSTVKEAPTEEQDVADSA